jgi:outer membrane protein insertion porin family
VDPTVTPAVSPDLVGRRVDEVRIAGNAAVSSQVILNRVRTHVGDKFDPATVAADYQRVFDLKRFSNVEARVEPDSGGGVAVIFQVSEEKLIKSVRFAGNRAISADDLAKTVDVKAGEAIENFRIALAKRAIETAYRAKNFPYTHVTVDNDLLGRTGELVFRITEAQPVTVRKIEFIGRHSFTYDKLNDQVKTTRWYWIFNAGTYDEQQLDADVASVRKFYRDHGFFDVKVGRKVIVSPDQTEVQIDFLIDEGVRYKVDRVTFVGNKVLNEAQLRQGLRLTEGQTFDSDVLDLDVKQIVKDYSPLGYIYDPRSNDPDYLRIGRPGQDYPARVVYRTVPGTVELVYDISEGKPIHAGRFVVVGNERSQDKLALRELRMQPGQLYNSGAVDDAIDRLRGSPYFTAATIEPIPPAGGEPDTRDVLVNVKEAQTASIGAGAAVNSNLGLNGNFTYEQKNFDIANVPGRVEDLLSDRSFTGAGQEFRVNFQPGTQVTSASVLFAEPYLFDLPYSDSNEAYYRQFIREAWYEQHAGGSISLGKQFNYVWSGAVTLQGEDVKIGNVQDFFPLSDKVDIIDPITHEPQLGPNGAPKLQLRSVRAPDVLEYVGHNTVTDVGVTVRRDTTNHGPLEFEGSSAKASYEFYGGLGGSFYFNEFNLGLDDYVTVNRDLLDRRTVLGLHGSVNYIAGDAPFFERFYGGGIGDVRGFAYRGIGPRAGRDQDPIGGNFNFVTTAELNFPVYGDNLRGVVFDDLGTVEPDIRIHTIRDSVGFGVRVVIPFISRAPLAFDLAFPVSKADQDIRQVFSFGARTQ